ncbi:MFS transporter [Phyllobacterium sp. 0TCS1.6C]|uniref:MFS transporter n=1 Tax=unclassified Phyllobacterium TaxID=2638441 RepID=UPI0022641DC3|nr:MULTISPECIES: MFS transporter [unclassified Phyllobacterium]MCX8279142.1 MFS transporter [Phyllobacterium sp. 0TCS1.6C]MCX8293926.1 MFS transporter [Phyllobacterium sp. 0TCS1.6A]
MSSTGNAPSAVNRPADTNPWLVLFILCLSVVLSMTTWFSATAITPELKAAWQLSDSIVAWLTNGVQIGFVTGALLASLVNLPDIVRLNRLMAVASILAAGVNALLLLEPGPVGAVACRFATGVALAAVYPPALKLVSTWFVLNRGLALGAVVGALTLGSSMPHLFRTITEHIDWRLVIGLSSAASLVAALSFLLFAREGPYPFGKAVFDPRQIGQVLRDRDLFLVNIGYFGHMWELYAMWAWLLMFMRTAAEGTVPPNMASFITFVAIAVGLFGCVAGGLLSDRFGRTATTMGLMVVSGLCALLIGFAFSGPTWLLILIAVVWGIAIVGDSPLFSAAVTELADRDLVGTALSLQMGLGFALTVFVIWLMPHLAAWLGSWQWCFVVLAPGPFIGAWAMLILRRSQGALKLSGGRR